MSLRKRSSLLEMAQYSNRGHTPRDVYETFIDHIRKPGTLVWLVVEVVQGNREFTVSGSPLKIGNFLKQASKDNPDDKMRYRVIHFTSDRNEARRKAQEV